MNRTLRPRRSLAAAAAVAALLTLAACGGDSDSGGEAASSSMESSESPDSSESSSPATDDQAKGEEVDPAAFVDDMKAGLEASTTAQMTMSVDTDQGGIEAEGQVDYTTKPPAMAMSMTSPMTQDPIDMRLVDGVVYMNLGQMSQDKFVAFDLSDKSAMPLGMSGLTGQMDPLAAFEQLEPALKTVTFVGDEDVDGEQLAHYRIALDPEKLAPAQGMPAARMPDQIDADLFFDDQFRPRQMTMDLGQEATVETSFFDWGEPVDIEAPPEDDVVHQGGGSFG